MSLPGRFGIVALPVVATLAATGCVRRTMTIRSSPPGALVWVNDREIGRTPLDVDFLHYGTYDVRLELEGYEPLATTGKAQPPWWDVVGPDLLAELLPLDLQSDVLWEYQLEPVVHDREALIRRARELRAREPATDGDDAPPPAP
jgi:hypothetical protein